MADPDSPSRQSSLQMIVGYMWRWATHDARRDRAEPGGVEASVTFYRSAQAKQRSPSKGERPS